MLLPALTGLLLVASFPNIGQGYLAWVSFVPLLIFVFRSETVGRAALGGFVAGFIELFGLLLWIPTVMHQYGGLNSGLAWGAYAFMVSLLACYPAATCAAAKYLMVRGGKYCLLLFPAAWVLSEYAQTLFPFGGLPWLLAGYSQTDWLSLIQIADIAGIYGISFVVLLANAAIAWVVLPEFRGPARFVPLAAALTLVSGCVLYGRISLHRYEKLPPDRRVAMLQGNLSPDDSESVLVEKYQQGYRRMADSIKDKKVDLLILPESPSPVLFQYNPAFENELKELSTRYPLGLIFNNIQYREKEGVGRYFNSAYYLDGNGRLAGVYDKMHLVPFGEYIPFKKLFPFIETITRDVGEFSPGRDYRILKIGNHPSNAVICFEAVFPALVRRFVFMGSRLTVNLTNDGWYGRSAAPYQHLAIARLRAVENRRYLLRAANSGISAVIEPSGNIQASTGLFQEQICMGRFAFLSGKTLYTRYGDVLVFLCAIILFGFIVFSEFRKIAAVRGRNRGGTNARRTQ